MTERAKRLAAGAREDLANAKAQRKSAYQAYASGQAKKADYDAAVAEIDQRIGKLEAAIAGYEREAPASATRRKGKGRTTHVLCKTPGGYRWLLAHARGAEVVPEGFRATNEAQWAQSLQAAEGKEIG